MSAPLLWPRRQNCRTCRCRLSDLVVLQLYCSYHCAGLSGPSRDPAQWPRQHAYLGKEKIWYFSREEAEHYWERLGQPLLEIYQCDYCSMWHLGHSFNKRVERYTDTAREQDLAEEAELNELMAERTRAANAMIERRFQETRGQLTPEEHTAMRQARKEKLREHADIIEDVRTLLAEQRPYVLELMRVHQCRRRRAKKQRRSQRLKQAVRQAASDKDATRKRK